MLLAACLLPGAPAAAAAAHAPRPRYHQRLAHPALIGRLQERDSAVCIFREIGSDVQAEQLGHSLAATLDLIDPLPSRFFLLILFFWSRHTHTHSHTHTLPHSHLTIVSKTDSPGRVCVACVRLSAFALPTCQSNTRFGFLFPFLAQSHKRNIDQDQANLTRS
jgi:hypothetical protein